jgi:transcriptional regulator with XRE-family HTH domain
MSKEPEQGTKFSENMTNIKQNIKRLRIDRGYDIDTFAGMVGLSRKQLEDLETPRNYGSFIGVDVLCKCADALHVNVDWLRKEWGGE